MNNPESAKGLVHVYTGDGKGKTTAALGLALRASGQGMKVIVIQFVKGDADCGEHLFAAKHHLFEMIQMAKGNCFTKPSELLRQDATKTFAYASEVIASDNYGLVILDEILIALSKGLLNVSEVLDLINRKPDSVELVLTGRNAPPEVIEAADLVTEMRMVCHPRQKGIPGRRGIEF